MDFAVAWFLQLRDYWQAGRGIPKNYSAPPRSLLFSVFVDRQFDSVGYPINLFVGVGPYWTLMQPSLSDDERARRIVQDEWPKVKGDIDSGQPSPIGLIEAISSNPYDLVQHHQVLAYKYQIEDNNRIQISVYDPNLGRTPPAETSQRISPSILHIPNRRLT